MYSDFDLLHRVTLFLGVKILNFTIFGVWNYSNYVWLFFFAGGGGGGEFWHMFFRGQFSKYCILKSIL